MKKENKTGTDIRNNELPQNEVFDKKEVYQHPQPADEGLPLKPKRSKDNKVTVAEKEEERTMKEEGLNEEKSKGNAGAFEGFEDHASD
ncbi:MAG: hypothetical protein ABIQ31_14345 [Ferruginibacter sp.]